MKLSAAVNRTNKLITKFKFQQCARFRSDDDKKRTMLIIITVIKNNLIMCEWKGEGKGGSAGNRRIDRGERRLEG